MAQKAQKLLQPSAILRYAQPGPVVTTRGISSTGALWSEKRLHARRSRTAFAAKTMSLKLLMPSTASISGSSERIVSL